MSTQRQANENFKEYKVRLYRNKEIYGLNNDEIGELLNADTGNNWNESAYRKHAVAYIEGWDDAIKAGISDDVALSELDKKMDELYKQQVKTRDKHRELRSSLRDEARIENLKDVFIECAREISQTKPLNIINYPKSNGDRVAILQLSDLHAGETINDFLNTYDIDTFTKRMKDLAVQVIDYCKLMNVQTLKVLNLGDWVSGDIHATTRINAEEDVVSQTMLVAEIASEILVEFAKVIENVEFCSVTDNHSRTNKNYKEHIEKESFSRFIPWFVKERVKNIKNIKVIENRINEVKEYEIGVIDIFHEKALFIHGHNDKINTMVADLTLMTKIFPIAIFTGHLHKNYEDEVHGIDLIMNPSLVGSGEFSKKIRKTSKARQKMVIYEQKDIVERVATFYINFD